MVKIMKLLTTLLCVWILVACGGGVTSSYSLGGSISGLGNATGLTLTNGTETLPIAANATVFTFATKLVPNASYNVAVASQPSGLTCSVGGGAAIVAGADVTSVAVKCLAVPTLALFAGNLGGSGNIDGSGAAARFYGPNGVAADGAGNVYVAEIGSHTIRKITPSGVVSTLAGTTGITGHADGVGAAASFYHPRGIATDGAGNVYVADTQNNAIRKITPAGVVSTLAGSAGVKGGADGIGAAASFSYPSGIATDAAGNVYVTDVGALSDFDPSLYSVIRKITPAGVVSTLAGTAGVKGSVDGVGPAASFRYPQGIATDGVGNIYVADSGNHTIRKITSAGVVSTLAGSPYGIGHADGSRAAASFYGPTGVATDSAGNVYVTDGGNCTVRKITTTGVVTTLAGTAAVCGSADGTGAAASFYHPIGIATGSVGNVYVADTGNHTIRKITPAGSVGTLAGLAGVEGSADGSGATARFRVASGMATDSAGNVYVTDSFNCTIRKITTAGVVTTLAGRAAVCGSSDGTGAAASFSYPSGIATDAVGNAYVVDSRAIRKITPAGVVSTLAGTAAIYGSVDWTGAGVSFGALSGIATDSSGNLYVAESGYRAFSDILSVGGSNTSVDGGHTIRKITPTGVVSTLAGTVGVAGSADGIGTAASFSNPKGMATDGVGNIYVADMGTHTIRKITPTGVVSTLAGTAGVEGSADGIGAAASFSYPSGIATDGVGNVYVADMGNNTIRKITPAGVVSTLAGVSGRVGFAAGALPGGLSGPVGLAISGTTLYVTLLNGVAVVANLP